MISIEAARDGFVVSLGGRRLIVHSRRNPCIELGEAELGFRRHRGGVAARRRRTNWIPLRDFAVLENDPGLTLIDFGGLLRLSFHREEELLTLGFECPEADTRLFRMRLQAVAGEHLYGLGEGGAPLDLKGRTKSLWAMGRGGLKVSPGDGLHRPRAHNGHPLPGFVSSDNYWLAVDSSALLRFDFRRRASTLVEAWSVPTSMVLGARPSALGVAQELRSVLGRPAPTPAWAYDGVCLGVDWSRGTPGLQADLDAALEAGAKVAALWSEGHPSGRQGSSPRRPLWDSLHGHDQSGTLATSVKAWRDRGIRYLEYADPCLDRQGPLYDEARLKGYLVGAPQGGDYLVGREGGLLALVDLTNPEASAWLKDLIATTLLGIGAAGWLVAGGDRLPPDAVLHSREKAANLHNRWPLLWAQLCAEALASRSGAAEGLLATDSTWFGRGLSGMASVRLGAGSGAIREGALGDLIPSAISLGLSGLHSVHFEVAAPDSSGRFLEAGAFSPLLATAARALGRSSPTGVRSYDPDFLRSLARISGVFASLKPYHEAVAEEVHSLGLPALRHPFLHYEGVEDLHRRDHQYLYGRDLLVAPAVIPGRSLTEVYLPEDTWVHLWSSRRFLGGVVTVESPPGFPAVFFREGSAFASLFDSIRRTTPKP